MNKKILTLISTLFVTVLFCFAEYYTYNPSTGGYDPHSSLGPGTQEGNGGSQGPNINSEAVTECFEEAQEIQNIIDELLSLNNVTDDSVNEESTTETTDKTQSEDIETKIEDEKKEVLEGEYCESDDLKTEDLNADVVTENAIDENAEPPVTEGDPVFIITGQYSLKETDSSFKWGINKFKIERNYLSFDYPDSSFGKNWNCSLDTRLVFGVSPGNEDKKQMIKKRIEECRKKSASFSSYVTSLTEKLDELEQKSELIKTEFIVSGVSNEKTLYGKAEKYFNTLRCNQILHVSKNGGVEIFNFDGNENCFKPVKYDIRNRIKIYYNNENNTFTVRYIKGKEITFTNEGLPLTEKDRYGLTVNYVYDENSRIKGISHKNREIITVNRDSQGKIITIRNNISGDKIQYVYDGEKLQSVIDAQNDKYKYEYDAENDLTALVKPDQSISRINYSIVSGNGIRKKAVVSHIDEEGCAETYEYDLSKKTVLYKDADGHKTVYEIEGNHIVKQTTDGMPPVSWLYDSNGQIISKTDFFGKTEYEYDEYGRISKETKGDKTRQWFYQNEFGKETSFIDEENNTHNSRYDDKGNCILKDTNYYNKSKYEYESWGGIKKTEGDAGKNSYEYNQDYFIVSDKDYTYKYNSKGELVLKKDKMNNQYVLSYDENGKKFSFTNPLGLEKTYFLNNRKDIEKVILHDLISGGYEITKIIYDRRHLIKEIYTTSGMTIEEAEKPYVLRKSCQYTDAGRISEIILWNYGAARQNDAAGICTQYIYDFANGTVVENKYFVDENKVRKGNVIRNTTVCSYTENVKKVSVSNLQTSIIYEYQQNNKLKCIRRPDGKTEEYFYDKAGKIIKLKNIYGGLKTISYSVDGNINNIEFEDGIEESFKYNEEGLLKEINVNNGEQKRFTYEDKGSFSENSVTDKLGSEKKIYDCMGNLTEYIVRDDEGKILIDDKVTYQKNFRKAKIEKDGIVYENCYDCFGRCIQSGKDNSQYTYDNCGNIILIKTKTSKSDAITEIEYNALNDVSCIKTPSGNIISFFYDADGNLIRKTDAAGVEWEAEYYADGSIKSEKGRLLPFKEYSYDNSGNLTEIKEAGDISCRLTYPDSNEVIITDAMGNDYKELYDQSGRLSKITDRLGNEKTYKYNVIYSEIKDFNGNSIKIEEKKYRGIRTVDYNSRDRQEIKWNYLNQITSVKNQNSTENYFYENNRLKKQIVDEKEYLYTYDAKGRKRTVRGPDFNEYFSYNEDNSIRQSVCNDLSVSYEYDIEGREISSYSTDGNRINKEYDAAGRIVSVEQKNSYGAFLFAEYYIYDEDGRIACISDHAGNVSLYEYDSHGRLSKVVLPYDKEIENNFIKEFTESGDVMTKNVVYKTMELPKKYIVSLKKIWSKNRLRLPNAQNGQLVWTEKYTYDLNGNRIKKETPAGTINYFYDRENRLVKYGDKNFVNVSYDKNGNMILKKSFYKTTKLTYSLNNRITNIVNLNKKDNVSESFIYTYDALSRRITKSKNGRQTMRTVYDGFSMNPLTEYRISGKSQNNIPNGYKSASDSYFPEQRSFLYVNNILRGQTSPSDAYVFCNDLRGSIRSVNSVKKAKTYFIDYDANGNPSILSNSKSAVPQKEADSFGLDRLYCGKEYDSSNNLYDYGYRYYSPFNSTFSSADPVLDGFNWYSYCANDPVNFLDPDGLTLLQVYYNFKMQNELWGDKLVGRATEKEIKFIETINTNGEKEKKEIVLNDLKSIGCAITVMSNLISSSIDKDVTPNDINNMKEVFSENKGEESDLDMEKLGDEYGLKFDYWTAEKTNLANKLLEIKGSNEPLYVVANVKYTLKGNTHWVSVQDTVEMDGKFYLLIKGSSINDKKSSRKRDGWIEKDGKVLIEIDEVVKLYTFDATDAKDREEVLCSK